MSKGKKEEKKDVIEFNAYDSELLAGINLIEASAGTGKTFSIAMLVARFIIEKHYRIDQLLVVTFTNAAAQELRDRIRARLVEIKAVLSLKPSSDSTLNQWVANLHDQDEAKELLINALADIDSAHIFTIHGFCQRILSQYALESGQTFGAELLQNDIPLKQQIAEDYWRLQTYARSLQQVSFLREIAKSPYALLNKISSIQDDSILIPDSISLDDCLTQLEDSIKGIKLALPGIVESLSSAIEADQVLFKVAFVKEYPAIRFRIEYWLSEQCKESIIPVDAILALSTQGLCANALNGNKFRKTKTLSAEKRKQTFLSEQGLDLVSLDAFTESLATLSIAFKRGLYEYQQVELDKRLTQSNQLSFDGMIKRLASALQGEQSSVTLETQRNSEHLKQVLQEKFPVAMIDEFQDTDDAQWSIFSSLADQSNNYLYLIGDPKQAIYRFRGADIYSYLSAQKRADRKYNLATNWRSQPGLISAVNCLFDVNNPFLISEIDYLPVKAASNTPFLMNDCKQSLEKLVLWELDKNPFTSEGYWLTSKGKPKEQVRSHVVSEILSLLNNSKLIQLMQTEQQRDLCPADIAILLRSNTEAVTYQQVLADYGLPAVLNSKISVFTSSQAEEIYHILQAVLRAGNVTLMRYALCQPWFGYTGNDLYELQSQQDQMDDWIISFQLYHELWEKKGLLAMMQRLMSDKQVIKHLANFHDVERRLTNMNHILELVQEAAITNRLSMIKTLEWLEDAIQGRVVAEGQELRLESDENAVNIVTIHSSKGLEYPIVFCPDLWAKSRQPDPGVAVFHKGDKQYSDLGSEQYEAHQQQTLYEDRAEELRLLYVAITRAKYRCYIAWANQRTKAAENQSALAYLLKQQAGGSWTERLKSLCEYRPDAFDYQLLKVNETIEGSFQGCTHQALVKNRKLSRQIRTDWMMTSYSALAYYSVHDEHPELPVDKSQEQSDRDVIEIAKQPDEELEVLPKGAHTGNLVHELLELIPFKTLVNPSGDETYLTLRDELKTRFAVDISNDQLLDELLQNTVNTALSADDSDFTLANLRESQCLKEMPFYFAVEQLKTSRINQVLQKSESYLPLSSQHMSGQLTGFIDLICEYQGRYYVMDYKTNSLTDYSVKSMTEAMREHNYGLQYWLYTLVLHRYLQQTLADYDFNRHFGGVRYLFVRGMNPAEPMSGVFQDRPDLKTLNLLSEVFSHVVMCDV